MDITNNMLVLENFLKTDNIVLGPDKYCREKIFVEAFIDYCEKNDIKPIKWKSEIYILPFFDFGIKVLENARRRYPNRDKEPEYSDTFLSGVDISERMYKKLILK